MIAKKYFLRWREIIADRKWYKIQDELAAEAQFAMNNDMETEFWCWNCKHSDCDRHKVKKTPCAGKTQRVRDCHINATTYRNGLFFCKYHF
jgi:hypothetical protein